MTAVSPSRNEAFDTTDSIFDFEPIRPRSRTPPSPKSTSKPDVIPAEAEFTADLFDFDPVPKASSPVAPQRDVRRMETPPPDMEEEPDWEAELAQLEAESGLSGLKPSQVAAPRAVNAKGKGRAQEGFGEADIFAFDIQPEASSSRQPARTSEPAYVSSRVEPRCNLPPLRAETASGNFILLKRRFKPQPKPLTDESQDGRSTAPSLLGQPLHHLLQEVEELKSEQKAIQLQRAYDVEARLADPVAAALKASMSSKTMWVDKYRPKKFSDLLGEDRTHRDVMSWLKEWDKCVFKRAAPGKKRKAGAEEEEVNAYTDHLGRPRERILLLSGPPGFGKTTLAHVLTRQAGYKVLEINASDDRNAATVSTRIQNAIDAGSGLGDKGKPVCVVVDEIDGATGGDQSFVKSLIKLIQDVPANRKKNTPAKPLRRPIICICNDLYATSLRPLRQYARIVRFRKPAPQILVKRLKEVCERESLGADVRVLTSLVDLTGGDVRSCLNTLQFIKSKSGTVTEDQIRTTSIGSKDSLTSLQSVWNALFIPLASKERRKQHKTSTDGRYIQRLVPQITSCGDMDRLVQGCFEHYPNLKPLDGSLANICRLLDGPAGFYDVLSKRIGEGEYETMGYMGYAVCGWYAHMAAPANGTRLAEFPKADWESYQARIVNEEVSTSVKSGFPPILRSLFSTTTTLTELIPLLIRIITPPLRPVNANIVKPAEKAVLDRLVELMIPHGLSFWQEKAENGQPMMRLEPPIDCFVHYEGKRADDIAAGRFAVRQVVAQAMGSELARRKAVINGVDGKSAKDTLVGMYGAAKKGHNVHAAPAKPDALILTDFFGRALAKKPSAVIEDNGDVDMDQEHDTPPPPTKRFRAVYKFHEGSSSAVRKCIKISTLM